MSFLGFGNYNKPGKGIVKEELQKRRGLIFFEVVFRKFWKMLQLSLLYTFCSIPALIIYLFVAMSAVSNLIINNSSQETFATMAEPSFMLSILVALGILLFIGSGPVSCGFVYVLRNFSREEHAWIYSDFFEHFKKNFKQGMAMFLIDIVVIFLMSVNALFYMSKLGAEMPPLFRTIIITLLTMASIVYVMMHFYIYPMMVTFDLKFKQILKNSLLLTFYKLPQNVGMLILTVAIFGGVVYFSITRVFLFVLIPLLVYSFSTLMQLFYCYSVIEKVMIGEKEENEEDIERTFKDSL